MTRRTRSAALFTVTAITGLALSLALAPTANAADGPNLGELTVSPGDPQAGQLVRISGGGCFGLDLDPGTTADEPSAAPDAVGVGGSVVVTITGPGDFASQDSAEAGPDGSWAGVDGITLGDAGEYTVRATCTVLETGVGSVGYPYPSQTLQVSAPPQVVDPGVSCFGCDTVNPGGSITVSGTNFPAGETVAVTLPGYAAQNARADAQGGVAPVTVIIRADQAPGGLTGTMAAASGASVAFQVVVTAPQSPGGNADGDVPPVTTTPSDDDTDSSNPVLSGGGARSTATEPSLPATGTDSLWPGVVGASLLVAGSGLVWAGRRRPGRTHPAV